MDRRELELKIVADASGIKVIAQEAKKAGTELKGAGDKGKKGFEGLDRKLKLTNAELQKLGQTAGRVGTALTIGITVPLAAIAALSLKVAIDFESSFAGIKKTVDGTSAEFAQLAKEIKDLSAEIPISVNELNKIGEIAGQLGVGIDDIKDFTRVIAELGVTTNLTTDEAALSLARFSNIMGTSLDDVSRLGSVIVELGNNFAALESEIVQIGLGLAPLGNTLNLTEAQVLALSATIAASGGVPQAAATAFQLLGRAIKDAVITGGDDLQIFADLARQTGEQFQESFGRSSVQALQDVLQGLNDIEVQGGSTTPILEELGLANSRLVREIGKVAANLGQFTQALKDADEEWIRNLALTEEAEKRYETTASELKKLKSIFQLIGIEIGDVFTPAIKSAVISAGEFLQSLRGIDPATIKLAAAIGLVFAAVGPMLIAFSTTISLLAAMGVSFTAIIATMGLVTFALAGIAAGAITVIDNWEFLKDESLRIWADINTGVVAEVTSLIDNVLDLIRPFVSEVKAQFQSIFDSILAQAVRFSPIAALLAPRGTTEFVDDTGAEFQDFRTRNDLITRTSDNFVMLNRALQQFKKGSLEAASANEKLNVTLKDTEDKVSKLEQQQKSFTDSLDTQIIALTRELAILDKTEEFIVAYDAGLLRATAATLGLGAATNSIIDELAKITYKTTFSTKGRYVYTKPR